MSWLLNLDEKTKTQLASDNQTGPDKYGVPALNDQTASDNRFQLANLSRVLNDQDIKVKSTEDINSLSFLFNHYAVLSQKASSHRDALKQQIDYLTQQINDAAKRPIMRNDIVIKSDAQMMRDYSKILDDSLPELNSSIQVLQKSREIASQAKQDAASVYSLFQQAQQQQAASIKAINDSTSSTYANSGKSVQQQDLVPYGQ